MQTLLVVDDDEQIVEMVQDFAELKGYEVLPATSPEEALRVLETQPGRIDLLITDVVMPGMLSEKARKLRPGIHVLFMSGFVVVPAHYGLSSEERGLEAGASILAKPFTGARLHEKICEVLGPASSAFLSEKARKLRPGIHVLFMSGFVVVPAHYGLSSEERGLEAGASILAKPSRSRPAAPPPRRRPRRPPTGLRSRSSRPRR